MLHGMTKRPDGSYASQTKSFPDAAHAAMVRDGGIAAGEAVLAAHAKAYDAAFIIPPPTTGDAYQSVGDRIIAEIARTAECLGGIHMSVVGDPNSFSVSDTLASTKVEEPLVPLPDLKAVKEHPGPRVFASAFPSQAMMKADVSIAAITDLPK